MTAIFSEMGCQIVRHVLQSASMLFGKRTITFRPDEEVLAGMNRVRERHGTPFSEQIRRALRAWLREQLPDAPAAGAAVREEHVADSTFADEQRRHGKWLSDVRDQRMG